MWARIRSKLPSRNTSIVLGTVGSIVSYRYYNNRQCKRIMNEFKEKAEVIANEPIDALGQVRKVKVYISPSPGELSNNKGYAHWNKYILPIFTAGALDYDLVLVSDQDSEGKPLRGSTHSKVCQDAIDHRRKDLESMNPVLRSMAKENERRRRMEENGGVEPPLEDDQNAIVQDPYSYTPWSPSTHSSKDMLDIIAIGRHTFTEVINGISEGFESSLNDKPVIPSQDAEQVKEVVENDLEVKEISEPVATEEPRESADELSREADVSVVDEKKVENNSKLQLFIDYDEYARHESVTTKIPAIGYISHFNQTGWGALPIRIWYFLNDTANTKLYGQQALKIVLDVKRPWRSDDKFIGVEEEQLAGWNGQTADVVLSDNVKDNLEIYDNQEKQQQKSGDDSWSQQ